MQLDATALYIRDSNNAHRVSLDSTTLSLATDIDRNFCAAALGSHEYCKLNACFNNNVLDA